MRDVRDGVLLVEFPEASDEEANRAAIVIGRRLAADAPAGLRDAVPAARTLLVVFDPERLPRRGAVEAVTRAAAAEGAAPGAAPRLVRLPVAYGGETALDLPGLARAAGLPEDELVRRHAAAEYRVLFLGFAPGFAYLAGLPPELRAPRLTTPRPRVPAGAVAIGGPYAGVYPAAMPGGWRLIGRTSARLWDPDAPSPAMLAAGDRVRFEAVSAEELAAPPSAPPARARAPEGRPAFRVLGPGLATTVQGGPGWGLGSSGVPPGGAMDLRALARANRLVGNGAFDLALEITLAGPELEALEDVRVAVAGGDFEVALDGKPASPDGPLRVRAGSRLRLPRSRRGARAYLAVEGGLVETFRPGEPARRIEAEQVLAARRVARERPDPDAASPPAERDRAIRVVPGPQSDHFAPGALDRFLSSPWRVSSVSDRRGLRLEGERLEHARAPEIPPEGTVFGSIQVPGDGLPIVLGPDGPVTGGYPKIATVIEADLSLLGQAAPGDVLRFGAVTLADAERARRE